MTRRPHDGLNRRVWVADVGPRVDGGRYPIKRVVGERVRVTADILADGHDMLAAVVLFRAATDESWRESRMRHDTNDLWRGEFRVDRLEPFEYTVEAWIDRVATWQDGLRKKADDGQDVTSELLDGQRLLAAAAARADGDDRDALLRFAAEIGSDNPADDRVRLALSAPIGEVAGRWPDRSRATRFEPVRRVDVNRERARFGAWYEMFPRSEGPDPSRGATLREAEARLPAIAEMGFDVLYLPPIHPIGRTRRKGPNNALAASPGDPGSPWAIGAEEGGHTAVHPELGTLDDFEHFRSEAERLGLELALDVAFQCSPDHPWVREHPDWFRRRPDGTIRYAENPPKKYQDIFPLDFECDDWQALWVALRDVLLCWVERDVRIFRVDNPHTKPLRFWSWVIPQVKAARPDAIFLSEAFTRPKMMYALAMVGFDQSYTYFTWRNTGHEIIEYLGELTATDVAEFFRPNLFANTPDILPEYLQFGGRPAFQARLVLAATLGASYGIYAGFELCENEALPGREEYKDSEKYQLRRRDWNAPGSLHELIRRINGIRRDNAALQSDRGLRFHPTDNEQLLCYSKRADGGDNVVLAVVNLDPHNTHDGHVELPIDELGIDEHESYQMHDMIGGGRYLWTGARNYVRLDPHQFPAHVFRLRRKVRTERDFDYFL